MKWEIIDVKHDVASGTHRDYKVIIEATKNGNILDVIVSVPAKPAKIKPVNWTNTEIKNWISEKGFNISKTLTKNTLTNETENSKIYKYELVPPVQKVVKPKTTKTRRKTQSTTSTRKTGTSN